MEEYKILEHITDLKIQGFGKTKEELFLNMLKGVISSLKVVLKDDKMKRKIKVESTDLDALLVDFLNEILYLSQTNKEIYNDVKFNKFSERELQAELIGNKVESFMGRRKNENIRGIESY